MYEVPNIVDGTITEARFTPESDPYKEQISEDAPLSQEVYHSTTHHLFVLKVNYKKLGKDYSATYSEYLDNQNIYRLNEYKKYKVGDTIDTFIDRNDDSKILLLSEMPDETWLMILTCLLGLFIWIEELNKDKALIYKNEKEDANEISFKPIRHFNTCIFLSLQRGKKLLMFQPTVILSLLLSFLFIVSLTLGLLFCFYTGEPLWGEDGFNTNDLNLIIALCVCLTLCAYSVYPAFKGICHFDKDKNILWKGLFRSRKNMKNAIPLSSIKNIQIINYRTLTSLPAFQLNIITSDGQRNNLANVMNAKYVLKKLTSFLQVPVIKSTDKLKPQIKELFSSTTELSWSPRMFFCGLFSKITKKEGLVILETSNLDKAIAYGIIASISLYCFYILKFYPSTYNINAMQFVIILLIIGLYPLYNVFFPLFFNLKQNKFYNRQLFNPFSRIDLNDIACLQLQCSVGVKENSSYLCLNLVSKQGERFNLLSTTNYKSIKKLSNDLAKAINKPLLVDPIIEEIEASNNIA